MAKEELQGKLQRFIFRGEDGFIIAVIKENKGQETVVKGNIGEDTPAHKGDTFRFWDGEWEDFNEKKQYHFQKSERVVKTKLDCICEALAQSGISGVGKKTAKDIVNMFGEDTLRVMAENPQDLTRVSGIKEKRMSRIRESYSQQKDVMPLAVFFAENELPVSQALLWYEAKKEQFSVEEMMEQIQEDPYQLMELEGMKFLPLDLMALRNGEDPCSKRRLHLAVNYCLKSLLNAKGNTYLPIADLRKKMRDDYQISNDVFDETMESMVTGRELKRVEINGKSCIGFYSAFMMESTVAKRIYELHSSSLKPVTMDVASCIRHAEEMGRTYATEQKQAVENSIQNAVSVITGGPGTGKTTVISLILSVLKENGLRYLLASPTGRAAKRITESTGESATTIHRMLECGYDATAGDLCFKRNRGNRLETDCIIIDEASMIDLYVMSALMDAVPDGCRVIFVGDVDQLPSVGAGNVLRDLMDSGYIPVSRLTEVHRQGSDSQIVVNAYRINAGESLVMDGDERDFTFEAMEDEKLQTAIRAWICTKLTDWNPITEIQVIAPQHGGDYAGVKVLNKMLQQTLNPEAEEKAEISMRGMTFRVGDKVMQNKNDYHMLIHGSTEEESYTEVLNGDVGTITCIKNEEDRPEYVIVRYEDYEIQYDRQKLEEMNLAYAITVHKSQGSEYPVVIMPISDEFADSLAIRNLLYTAVTRGKRRVILLGSEKKLEKMIAEKPEQRITGLKQLLTAEFA